MKKMFVTIITLIIVKVSNAQNLPVFHPLQATPDAIYDSKRYERAVTDTTVVGDFNVLLSNENLATKSDYENYTDLNAQNVCKKINDTLYEIEVNNLAKRIILVNNCNNEDYLKYPLGQSIIHFVRLDWHSNITYSNNGTRTLYEAQCYFPTVTKYILQNRKTKKIIREFDFKYTYPKPLLILASANDSLTNLKRIYPSYDFNIEILKQSASSLSSIFKKKDSSILFVFDHLLRLSRIDENDELEYKFDAQKNWIHTSLSKTPSILLENLSVGNHTLYVKYPAQDADVLEYHFNIAPN